MQTITQLSEKTKSKLIVPTDLNPEGVAQITESLNLLLADVFALYLKTKSFHWHISGPHFRDYHLLLDEQAAQIFAMSDDIAERTRKIGGNTLRSISDISQHQRLRDNNDTSLSATDMLAELCSDNRQLTSFLRLTHEVASGNDDVATASLIENWIDESERRTWFLSATLGGS
ncbi:MAG: DNA starvation/stationary phase protection protein [Pyrinomonadaceae bacterium]|nr:DNA starvation/stationary phase protection protein [Pyrinomonadaceae bacterium]